MPQLLSPPSLLHACVDCAVASVKSDSTKMRMEDPNHPGPEVDASSPATAAQSTSSPTGRPPLKRSIWESWLTFSVFAFTSPDLERLYQSYFTSNIVTWGILPLIHRLVWWVVFLLRYLSASPAQVAQLPGLWWLAPFQALISGPTLAVMLLRPDFFSKHRRKFIVALHAGSALNLRLLRALLLWTEYVWGSGILTTLAQQMHAFSGENLYLVLTVLVLPATSIGQAADVLVLTAILAVERFNNRFICSLPFVKAGLLSLSPKPLAAAGLVSSLLTSEVEGNAGLRLNGAEPTEACPAVLWLWQLVGWWLTCHVLLVAEILWRRAFLRTPTAHALLDPTQRADALSWPLSRVKTVQSLLIMSFAVTCSLSIVWQVTSSSS